MNGGVGLGQTETRNFKARRLQSLHFPGQAILGVYPIFDRRVSKGLRTHVKM